MGERKEPSPALEKLLSPATGLPERPAIEEAESRLNIAVVFTSAEATIAAMKRAGALAEQLNARITLVVAQIVPWPLPLDSPPVLLDFSEKRFRDIADQSPVDITVRLYLCRDRLEVLRAVLAPHSLVVVGGRKRWWPTPEKHLASSLRRDGHEVIFAEME